MTLHPGRASQRSKLDRRFDKVHRDEAIGAVEQLHPLLDDPVAAVPCSIVWPQTAAPSTSPKRAASAKASLLTISWLCAIRAPGCVGPNETHCWPARTWRGEYGAGGARPDTETLAVLRGPAPDCADRHIRGSMRRLRRNGASGSQHGACGGEMEQKEGGRVRLVIDSPDLCQPHARSDILRVWSAAPSAFGCQPVRGVLSAIRPGDCLLVRRCILAGRAAAVATA